MQPYEGRKEMKGKKTLHAISHYACPAEPALSTPHPRLGVKKEQGQEVLGEGCISQ